MPIISILSIPDGLFSQTHVQTHRISTYTHAWIHMDVYTCVGKCTFDILLSFGLFHCKISGTLRHTTPHHIVQYDTKHQIKCASLNWFYIYILYAYTCNYICSSFEVLNKRWNAINLITWKEASTNRTRMPLTRGVYIYIYPNKIYLYLIKSGWIELNWRGHFSHYWSLFVFSPPFFVSVFFSLFFSQ